MKKFYYYFILIPIILVFTIYGLIAQNDDHRKDLIGVKYSIKKNTTIISILKKAGIKQNIRDSIILQFEKTLNLKQCMANEEIYVFTNSDMNFRQLEYRKNIVDIYIVEYDGNSFNMFKKPNEKKIHTAYISGRIKTNLYETLISLGEGPELVKNFSYIFAKEIDCNSNRSKNDEFEILVEKIFINDKLYTYGKILYASYETDKRLYEGFYYKDDDFSGYFDMDGNSLNEKIIKAPMAFYSRISSGFTQKRLHPVLKIYLPHKAIDYAAPRGTPVYAAADGIIKHKFLDRYGGRVLFIEHDDGYETEYMHLQSYSKNSQPGKFVKQGDIIGYVGNSGSSTGYHLHFAVKHNNVYINPRRMHFESEIVLNEDQINTYCNYREIIYSLLFATKSFIEFPTYCSKKRYLFEYANIIGKSPNL